jgi:hypothetical protein
MQVVIMNVLFEGMTPVDREVARLYGSFRKLHSKKAAFRSTKT